MSNKMKLHEIFKTSTQLLLIYFVTLSDQFINENVKGTSENVLNKKRNEMLIKNAGKLATPTPQKVFPIRVIPQPLLIRRKVRKNSTETLNPRSLRNKNKLSIYRKVDEPKTKQVPVEEQILKRDLFESKNNNNKSKVHFKPATKIPVDEYNFSEVIEDFSNQSGNDKEDTIHCIKESKEVIPDTNIENDREKSKNNELIACKVIKNQKQEETNESDSSFQHSSSENDIQDNYDDVRIDIHEGYKVNSNQPNNCSEGGEINSSENKKVLKITNVPSKGTVLKEPKIDLVHTRKCNSENKNLYEACLPNATELEIAVSPKVTEKLTNDANDKIFIKKTDYEEIQEKYDDNSQKYIKNENIDSHYAPDTTFIKEPYKYPLEDQIEIDEICENLIARRFPTNADKSLREKIWKAWKNSEIHVTSDKDRNKKRKEAKKYKPNINYNGAKIHFGVFGNVKLNPSNYDTSTKTEDQRNKSMKVEEKISFEGNIQLDPIHQATYESNGNQSNIVCDKTYVVNHSIEKNIPVDDTNNSRKVQINRFTDINVEPRFSVDRVKTESDNYNSYNLRAYRGNRPRNIDQMRRFLNYNGGTKFQADNYALYNNMTPQQYMWLGVAPSNVGIKYYSPNAYTQHAILNCYPQSFGTQYAPVSRYRKYLFPCM